jgi:cephalosporin-C deacetylase-like acetyl esterase
MTDDLTLTVAPDRSEAFYSCGAPVGFQINLSRHGEPVSDGTVGYVIRHNLGRELTRGTLTLRDSSVVTAQLDAPGFLDCTVTRDIPDGDPLVAQVGAAVSPLEIAPSMAAPDDFDAFWAAQLARLAAEPMSPHLEPVTSRIPGIELFDTRVAAADDTPVSGYFARPAGAAAGALPAVLTVHGAGVCSAGSETALQCAQRQWLAFDINAHGLPNGREQAWYDELAAGALADYRHRNCCDREHVYFVGMFLRVRRALDFLAAQPEWDGKVLVLHGHSQGGFQALAGAALDSRVTAFAAGVPAGCDHTGYAVDRPNGWPNFSSAIDNAQRTQLADSVRYVDGVHFAGRTRAEGYFSVGFLDAACNPVSVYAAYNNHPGPKRMINRPAMAHEAPPDIDGEFTRWMLEHARQLKAQHGSVNH